MSEQEHDQQAEKTADEREETMKDLEVPEGETDDVKGGTVREKWMPSEG